jgi:ADP-ribosylglycohydrolase
MYGAIIGDICGSIYEFTRYKTDNPLEINLMDPKCHFTDDSVLTCAVAEAVSAIDNGKIKGTPEDYGAYIHKWAKAYPNAGYGGRFRKWMRAAVQSPYGSYGNGSAMRVSAIGWAFGTLKETIEAAKSQAECTHNHPEGIKGSQAVAAAIYLARNKNTKAVIKGYIEKEFGYNLDRTLAEIRPLYKFYATCQKSVPEAIIAFLESSSFSHAIQCAISLGGDSDTIAAIAGSIAEAYYPNEIHCELTTWAVSKITKEMHKALTGFNILFRRPKESKII